MLKRKPSSVGPMSPEVAGVEGLRITALSTVAQVLQCPILPLPSLHRCTHVHTWPPPAFFLCWFFILHEKPRRGFITLGRNNHNSLIVKVQLHQWCADTCRHPELLVPQQGLFPSPRVRWHLSASPVCPVGAPPGRLRCSETLHGGLGDPRGHL